MTNEYQKIYPKHMKNSYHFPILRKAAIAKKKAGKEDVTFPPQVFISITFSVSKTIIRVKAIFPVKVSKK